MWHGSFEPFFRALVARMAVTDTALLEEMRAVFQRHRTTEYDFVLEELPSAAAFCGTADPATVFAAELKAFGEARHAGLRLYPGVAEGLRALRARGTVVVGVTESLAHYSAARLRRLGLDGALDVLYSYPDDPMPGGSRRMRRYAELHQAVADIDRLFGRRADAGVPHGFSPAAVEGGGPGS
ncbi:MAG: HAD family hydrolase [Bauldia sp.]